MLRFMFNAKPGEVQIGNIQTDTDLVTGRLYTARIAEFRPSKIYGFVEVWGEVIEGEDEAGDTKARLYGYRGPFGYHVEFTCHECAPTLYVTDGEHRQIMHLYEEMVSRTGEWSEEHEDWLPGPFAQYILDQLNGDWKVINAQAKAKA